MNIERLTIAHRAILLIVGEEPGADLPRVAQRTPYTTEDVARALAELVDGGMLVEDGGRYVITDVDPPTIGKMWVDLSNRSMRIDGGVVKRVHPEQGEGWIAVLPGSSAALTGTVDGVRGVLLWKHRRNAKADLDKRYPTETAIELDAEHPDVSGFGEADKARRETMRDVFGLPSWLTGGDDG